MRLRTEFCANRILFTADLLPKNDGVRPLSCIQKFDFCKNVSESTVTLRFSMQNLIEIGLCFTEICAEIY